MKFLIHKGSIIELISNDVIINNVQDALDLMANFFKDNISGMIVKKENLNPDFFELKTKFAGELMQKFINYNATLGIIGDFSDINSRSFNDFIYESNKIGKIVFASNIEECINKLK